MTVGLIVVGLMLVTMWLTAATSWRLRNWRAAAFLSAVSAAVLTAGLLPSGVAPWARAGLWGVAMLILLTRGELLSAMTREEYQFVKGYVGVFRRVALLKQRATVTDPATYIAEFEGAITSLEELPAPVGKWAELKADTVRELEGRLAIMRRGTAPPPGALEVAEARWSATERQFDQLVRAKAGFWAGWPKLISRSRN